jgi:glycosyltransferase involved in cell wall biosynthesis
MAGEASGTPRETARPVRVALTLEQCWHRVPGGTASSVVGLAAALAARDDIDVVGVAARHAAPPAEPAHRPAVPVLHLRLPRLALYEAWHAPGAFRWPPVERATGAVDVVHATAVAVPPSPHAPLVVTIHDLAHQSEPGAFTRHGIRFFRRGTELARRHARIVVVPSEATAAECRSSGFDPGRIRVVPWGHDVAEPAGAADVARVRAAYGLPECYVLFVGTVEPRKNLARLTRAWRGAVGPEVPLVLVGPAGWGEGAPSGPGIVAVGFVPAPDRDALYAGAAAVAYPSLREGFGLPVLEAMAQGAPVLTSAGTATEEVAGDAAVLVDPTDEAALAAGLRRILEDPDAARALGYRARERAATFTWARCAEGYVAAYREATT